jgi:hypothetical protein
MPATTTPRQLHPSHLRRRNFIVAAWEKSRTRHRDLRHVQAKSAEEAVAVVSASRTLTKEGAVYEAWPVKQPGCILRITLQPRRAKRSS